MKNDIIVNSVSLLIFNFIHIMVCSLYSVSSTDGDRSYQW